MSFSGDLYKEMAVDYDRDANEERLDEVRVKIHSSPTFFPCNVWCCFSTYTNSLELRLTKETQLCLIIKDLKMMSLCFKINVRYKVKWEKS